MRVKAQATRTELAQELSEARGSSRNSKQTRETLGGGYTIEVGSDLRNEKMLVESRAE